MPQIHPTASVSAQARLADDVVVGPYCVIEGPVELGPGCRLLGHVYIEGPAVIGARNTFYPFACIGFAPQHRRFDPAQPGAGLRIGDDNTFRESVTVHRAFTDQPTTLGSRNYLMVAAHIGHDCRVGDDCTFANSVLLGGHVEVGDGATLGGNAGIHQHCRIGRLAMVGGVCDAVQDVPPFCVVHHTRRVSSLNLVGLRRAGYRDHIAPLKRAFDLLYRRGHANQTAIRLIGDELGHDPLCREFAAFIAGTKRGIVSYARSREARSSE